VSQTLSNLVARVTADVPAWNSVPSSTQYSQAVKDAVADFNRRSKRTKITTLSIVSGTATYSLPADFISLIQLEAFTTPDGVIISGDGLIPVSATWDEVWTITNGQITFYPTPTYNLSRDLKYAAGHVLTGEEEDQAFAEMGDDEAALVVLKAAAICLGKQSSKASQQAWQYAIGDEKVNKEKLAGSFREDKKEKDKEYRDGVQAFVGVQGTRSVLSSTGSGVRY